MLVSEIMTHEPVTIAPAANVSQALDAMIELEFHQLPVLSEQGHLIGIINQRDCQRALGLDPWCGPNTRSSGSHAEVRHYMRPAPIVVEPRTPVQEAARLMTIHHLRCLPVMRDESLVGILTVSDLLIAFMQTLHRTEEAGTTQLMR
jgi:acetoin utilization protein AcuB